MVSPKLLSPALNTPEITTSPQNGNGDGGGLARSPISLTSDVSGRSAMSATSTASTKSQTPDAQRNSRIKGTFHSTKNKKNNQNNNANNNGTRIYSRNLDKPGNSSVVSGLGTPNPFGKEILSSIFQHSEATAASTTQTTTTVADGIDEDNPECVQLSNFSSLLSRRNKIHAVDASPTRIKSRQEMLGELLNDANFGVVVNAYNKHYWDIFELLLQCPELDLKNEYLIESGILMKVFGLGKMSEYDKIVTRKHRKSNPNLQRLQNDLSGSATVSGVASSAHNDNNNNNNNSYGNNDDLNYSSEQALLLVQKVECIMDENTHIFVDIANRLFEKNSTTKLFERFTKDELLQLNEYYCELYEVIVEIATNYSALMSSNSPGNANRGGNFIYSASVENKENNDNYNHKENHHSLKRSDKSSSRLLSNLAKQKSHSIMSIKIINNNETGVNDNITGNKSSKTSKILSGFKSPQTKLGVRSTSNLQAAPSSNSLSRPFALRTAAEKEKDKDKEKERSLSKIHKTSSRLLKLTHSLHAHSTLSLNFANPANTTFYTDQGQQITGYAAASLSSLSSLEFPSLVTLDDLIQQICDYLHIRPNHTKLNQIMRAKTLSHDGSHLDYPRAMSDSHHNLFNKYGITFEEKQLNCYFEIIAKAGSKVYCVDITNSNRLGFTSHDSKFYFYKYWRVDKDHLSVNEFENIYINNSNRNIMNVNKSIDVSFLGASKLDTAWTMSCTLHPSDPAAIHGGMDNTVDVFDMRLIEALNANGNVTSRITTRNESIHLHRFAQLDLHNSYISKVSFIDGKYIVSCSGDGSCILWNNVNISGGNSTNWNLAMDSNSSMNFNQRYLYTHSSNSTGTSNSSSDKPRVRSRFIVGKKDIMDSAWTRIVLNTNNNGAAIDDRDAACPSGVVVVGPLAPIKGSKNLMAKSDEKDILFGCVSGAYVYLSLVSQFSDCIGKFKGSTNNSDLNCLDISPNGKYIATGSDDGYVRIYLLDRDMLLKSQSRLKKIQQKKLNLLQSKYIDAEYIQEYTLERNTSLRIDVSVNSNRCSATDSARKIAKSRPKSARTRSRPRANTFSSTRSPSPGNIISGGKGYYKSKAKLKVIRTKSTEIAFFNGNNNNSDNNNNHNTTNDQMLSDCGKTKDRGLGQRGVHRRSQISRSPQNFASSRLTFSALNNSFNYNAHNTTFKKTLPNIFSGSWNPNSPNQTLTLTPKYTNSRLMRESTVTLDTYTKHGMRKQAKSIAIGYDRPIGTRLKSKSIQPTCTRKTVNTKVNGNFANSKGTKQNGNVDGHGSGVKVVKALDDKIKEIFEKLNDCALFEAKLVLETKNIIDTPNLDAITSVVFINDVTVAFSDKFGSHVHWLQKKGIPGGASCSVGGWTQGRFPNTHSGSISKLSVNRENKILASCGIDSSVVLYDVKMFE